MDDLGIEARKRLIEIKKRNNWVLLLDGLLFSWNMFSAGMNLAQGKWFGFASLGAAVLIGCAMYYVVRSQLDALEAAIWHVVEMEKFENELRNQLYGSP